MRMEINEDDLYDAIYSAITDIKVMILNDLLNEIEDNMMRMGLAGGQLMNDIDIDFDEGIIYINAPHAGYVEFGTVGERAVPEDPYTGTPMEGPQRSPGRKGPPPLPPISDWVRRKISVSQEKRFTRRQADIVGESVRWKIYHYGTKPQPYTRNAIDTIQSKYENVTITVEVAA